MPSIRFINRIYPPSEGATGRVLEFVAEGFVKAGWEVSVLVTATDSLPKGKQIRNGVTIYSVGAGGFSKRNILLRAWGYALMLPTLLIRSMTLPRADLIVTMTDPPMLLTLGLFIRFFKRSRLIHWAQDLYPEVAEELGVFHPGGAVATLLRKLSTLSMQCHDLVIVPGRCMVDRLLRRGISVSKICVVSNSGVEGQIRPLPRLPNFFREAHGLGDSFIVEYSGNMGRAHEFETVLEAASLLQEQDETILFLFVGNGPREASIKEEVRKREIRNILFLPFQSEDLLSESLGAGDLHLVTMREGMSGLVVPSKFYGIMAAARPCLFVGSESSEIALEIVESQAGAVIPPGDVSRLVSKILEYKDSPKLREMSGNRGAAKIRAKNSLPVFLKVTSELFRE